MTFRTLFVGSALLACALTSSPASFAQSVLASSATAPKPHGVFLTTPNPEIRIAPGNPVTFKLSLINDTEMPERADLALNGVPDGWTYSLKGGSYEVTSAMVAPGETGDLSLTLTPDKGASKQAYKLYLSAKYADGKTDLPLSVTLAELPSTGTTLVPDLPSRR